MRRALSSLEAEAERLRRIESCSGGSWTPTSHAYGALCRAGCADHLAALLSGGSPDDAPARAGNGEACAEQQPVPQSPEPAPHVETGLAVPTADAAAANTSLPCFGQRSAMEAPATVADDDLTLVEGVDQDAIDVLQSFGVTTYRDLAAFKPEDVEIISHSLGSPRRVSQEGWIEQAQLLSNGCLTAFACERLLSEAEALSRPAEDRTSDVLSSHSGLEPCPESSGAELEGASAACSALAEAEAEAEVEVEADTGAEAEAQAVEVADDSFALGLDEPVAEPMPEEPADTLEEAVAEPEIAGGPVARVEAPAAENPNIVAFDLAWRRSQKPRRGLRWTAVAASLFLLAAASIATLGMTPAFAKYLENLSCADALLSFVAACQQLGWLMD